MRNKKTICLIAAAICAVLPLAALFLVPAGVLLECAMGLGCLAFGVTFGSRDAAVSVSKALSNGAGTVYSDGIDLGHSANGDWLADVEFDVVGPALSTTLLPDTETMKYSIQHDTASDFSTVATLLADVLVQTGAGGAGADAATARVRLPSTVKRYIRLRVIKTGTGNASTVSGILRGQF